MRRIVGITLTGLTVAAALAACSSSDDAGGTPEASNEPTQDQSSAATGGAEVATAKTSLGTIVVDGKGMTAYYYDKDEPNSGSSVCTADCAAAWPAIEAASATPTVDGITGKVGTITGTDGNLQVTIEGRPIYTYAGDSKAGDVTGQGVGGIWYVVAPDGKELTSGGDTGGY
ncbi:COG4315 family predicted lipoprotein [Cellulomonas edaphi]|uniref:Lipoprotein with Yx(FWY)xxD motif n=1 Tax=Cellulomonas edaphi TaxID=3053468 RepID=A0ABT7S6T0_9CELL|nr:hypothetical protein [Cellulomons edaphi]MDM7831306.1 hypothetical protein [Cellulomons edaphi]